MEWISKSSSLNLIHKVVEGKHEMTITECMLDVVADACHARVSVADIIKKLKTVPNFRESSEIQTAFIDAIWFWGSQLEPKTSEWTLLAQFTKDCGTAQLVDPSLLRISLDLAPLAEVLGPSASEERVKGMLVKLNTGKLYQQQKFNLLREESEGFAKLVIALAHLPTDQIAAALHIRHIFALVGQFDLNPTRVLDLALDAYERAAWSPVFVSLLRHFPQAHLASILGLKFVHYHTASITPSAGISNDATATAITLTTSTSKSAEPSHPVRTPSATPVVPSTAPASLYTLAGLLLAQGLVTLNQLLPYLAPVVEQLTTQLLANEAALRKDVAAIGVVSLSAAPAAHTTTTTPVVVTASTSSSAVSAPVSNVSAFPSAVAGVAPNRPPPPSTPAPNQSQDKTASTNNLLIKNEKTSSSRVTTCEWDCDEQCDIPALSSAQLFADGNQLTGLISALLGLRCWTLARSLLTPLTARGVDPVRCTVIRESLTALLTWRLDALYQPLATRRLALSSPAKYTVGSEATVALLNCPDLWIEAALDAGLSVTDGLGCAQADRIAVYHAQSAAQIPSHQCAPFTELLTLVTDATDMLDILGHHVFRSPSLYAQLCRLLCAHRDAVLKASKATAAQDEKVGTISGSRGNSWDPSILSSLGPLLGVVSTVLLPGLSASEGSGSGSAFLAAQLWSVIAPLPFGLRFAIYDTWRGSGWGRECLIAGSGSGAKPAEVMYAEARALHSSKGLVKRLSKENTKSVGRQLSRVTHGNPLPVFAHVLAQVEVFDNLIPVVIEALRFSSLLSRDSLAWLCVTQLRKDGDKLKQGDTHYTQWFGALARFIGLMYARYPETEIRALLHFLLRGLQQGQSLDLLVLRELLVRMGGCETLLELSQQQLESLAGGRALRLEMMQSATSTSLSSAGKDSVSGPDASGSGARRLREEVFASHTAIPLLLCIAQVRRRIVHCTDTPHLKLVSHLYDTAQDVLMQFTDFLLGGLPASGKQMIAVAQLMPSLHSLVRTSGLSLAVAFQLVRPLVRAALAAGENPIDAPPHLRSWHPLGPEVRSVVRDYCSLRVHGSLLTERVGALDGNAGGEEIFAGPESDLLKAAERETDPWALLEVDLVTLFWTLSLQDLSCPSERYTSEIRRIKDRYALLEAAGSEGDKSAQRARRVEATRLLNTIKDLTDEFEIHKRGVEAVRRLLDRRKDQFIVRAGQGVGGGSGEGAGTSALGEEPGLGLSSEHAVTPITLQPQIQPTGIQRVHQTVEALLQVCVVERMLLSPADAIYSTQFFLHLQQLDTPGLSTLAFINKFLHTALPCVYCVTEAEAVCLGHALNEVLKAVNQYLNDKELFNRERVKAGFVAIHKQTASAPILGSTASSETGAALSAPAQQITLSEWQAVAKHYLKNLTNGLHSALGSREYMHLRATFIVLAKISNEYPTKTSIGTALLNRLEEVEKEQDAAGRADLQTQARGLLSLLRRRASTWVRDDGVQGLGTRAGSGPTGAKAAATKGPPPPSSAPAPVFKDKAPPSLLSGSNVSKTAPVHTSILSPHAAPFKSTSEVSVVAKKGDTKDNTTSTVNGPVKVSTHTPAPPPIHQAPARAQAPLSTPNQSAPSLSVQPTTNKRKLDPATMFDRAGPPSNSSTNTAVATKRSRDLEPPQGPSTAPGITKANPSGSVNRTATALTTGTGLVVKPSGAPSKPSNTVTATGTVEVNGTKLVPTTDRDRDNDRDISKKTSNSSNANVIAIGSGNASAAGPSKDRDIKGSREKTSDRDKEGTRESRDRGIDRASDRDRDRRTTDSGKPGTGIGVSGSEAGGSGSGTTPSTRDRDRESKRDSRDREKEKEKERSAPAAVSAPSVSSEKEKDGARDKDREMEEKLLREQQLRESVKKSLEASGSRARTQPQSPTPSVSTSAPRPQQQAAPSVSAARPLPQLSTPSVSTNVPKPLPQSPTPSVNTSARRPQPPSSNPSLIANPIGPASGIVSAPVASIAKPTQPPSNLSSTTPRTQPHGRPQLPLPAAMSTSNNVVAPAPTTDYRSRNSHQTKRPRHDSQGQDRA